MASRFYYGGHTYSFVTAPMNWTAASAYATQQGGHLAIITSSGENSTILQNAIESIDIGSVPTANDGGGAAYLWIGASDIASEGNWKWVDGSGVSGFTAWGSGPYGTEPDNYGSQQNAMGMGLQSWPQPSGGIGIAGKWNDINDNNMMHSVIEWGDLRGTNFDDSITGTSGNVLIFGLAGNDTLTNGSGNDAIDGGVGTDTAAYPNDARANSTLSKTQTGWIVGSSVDGTDTLTGVERLQFSDKKIALDLTPDGNAGKTLEFIGMMAHSLVNTPTVIGTILSIFDQGKSMKEVCQLAIDVGLTRDLAGSSSNLDLAKLVFQNVVGSEASAGDAAALASYIQGNGGTMTQADFLATVAQLDLNNQHIGLVGLQQTGVEYVI